MAVRVNEIALARGAGGAHLRVMGAEQPQRFRIDGNGLTPLVSGGERLRQLLALIGGAQDKLRLFYYIFDDDEAATQVRDALVAAARRGVAVSLTIDGFGSPASDAFLAPLVAAGGDVCRFLPRLGRRYLLRNHQKMALADADRAIIGGFNIANPYFDDEGPHRWRDLGLLVEGPAVARLAGYYDALAAWSRRPRAPMRELRRALARWSEPEGRVRWLMGGPGRWINPWLRAVRDDIGKAMRLDLISAYFAPNPAMLRRIEAVGRRGTARVMTAGRSDNELTIAAARHCYQRLLRGGVQVWEYRACRFHTKLLVIDDAVYVGSANFDMRSLFLNLELMLRVEDAEFADHMRAHAARERRRAQRITPVLHRRRRNWWARLRWGLAYFLVATLDRRLTHRLNSGLRWR